ncbi:MAG: hypothetical protein JW828_14900 [Sedimentisphaerales bacterium]|nr:hypothetical protein [Sedimentisphaerales bacterium]
MAKTNNWSMTVMIVLAAAFMLVAFPADTARAGGGVKYKILVKSPDHRCEVMVSFADLTHPQETIEKGNSKTFESKACPTRIIGQCWTAIDYVTDLSLINLNCENATYVTDPNNKRFRREW